MEVFPTSFVHLVNSNVIFIYYKYIYLYICKYVNTKSKSIYSIVESEYWRKVFLKILWGFWIVTFWIVSAPTRSSWWRRRTTSWRRCWTWGRSRCSCCSRSSRTGACPTAEQRQDTLPLLCHIFLDAFYLPLHHVTRWPHHAPCLWLHSPRFPSSR